MYDLQWKKAVPIPGSTAFVRVSDETDAPFVAGACLPSDVSEKSLFSLGGNFIPGVYDHKTHTCVIRDDDNQEQDFYVLAKSSTVNLEWISEIDGQIPVGAIQCGFNQKGEPLYVGRFSCDGRLLCGQVNRDLKRCDVKILNRKYSSNHYEVLCLKNVPIGFSYSSTYNLRSQVTPSSIIKPMAQVNGDALITSTPKPTPVTRTMTSSNTSTITIRKLNALQDTADLIQAKTLPTTPSKSSLPAITSWTPKPVSRKQQDTPKTRWLRHGNSSRLIRSPLNLVTKLY